MSKSYNELITLPTFEDRFMYLKMGGRVGEETFGFERYHNQKFYNSDPWRTFRRHIIERDMGCDLGLSDREIAGRIIIHHLNPITLDDILNGNPCYDCLGQGYNVDSHKPINFKEKTNE